MHALNEMIILYNELENDDFYKNTIIQMLKNVELIPTLSTYDLAERCYVSPATILRLSKKLGYESYGDFKFSVGLDLKEIHDNVLYSYEEFEWKDNFMNQSIDQVIKTLESIRSDVSEEKIGQAAKYLEEAKHIIFITGAGSSILRNLQMRLMLSGKDVIIRKTFKKQSLSDLCIEPGTLIFVIEMIYAGNYDVIIKKVKESGAKVVFVSNQLFTKTSDRVDLYIGFRGSTFRRDGIGIDILLGSISVAYSNRAVLTDTTSG